jgi:hypothetical protein
MELQNVGHAILIQLKTVDVYVLHEYFVIIIKCICTTRDRSSSCDKRNRLLRQHALIAWFATAKKLV